MDNTNNDPLVNASTSLVDTLEAEVRSFDKESNEALDEMEESLAEAEGAVAIAKPQIEEAAMEANAEIDDAVLELISDEEAE